MYGQSSGLPMQRKFLVQVFAVKKEGRDQYRSLIFPADRAMEGALFCEKWHKDESDVVGWNWSLQIRKPHCWAGVRSFWTISKGITRLGASLLQIDHWF